MTTGFLKNKLGTPHIPQDSATDVYGPAIPPDSTPHQLCMVNQAQQQLSKAVTGQFIPRCSPKEGSVLQCVIILGCQLDYIRNKLKLTWLGVPVRDFFP